MFINFTLLAIAALRIGAFAILLNKNNLFLSLLCIKGVDLVVTNECQFNMQPVGIKRGIQFKWQLRNNNWESLFPTF
jgi:hypothetical protein